MLKSKLGSYIDYNNNNNSDEKKFQPTFSNFKTIDSSKMLDNDILKNEKKINFKNFFLPSSLSPSPSQSFLNNNNNNKNNFSKFNQQEEKQNINNINDLESENELLISKNNDNNDDNNFLLFNKNENKNLSAKKYEEECKWEIYVKESNKRIEDEWYKKQSLKDIFFYNIGAIKLVTKNFFDSKTKMHNHTLFNTLDKSKEKLLKQIDDINNEINLKNTNILNVITLLKKIHDEPYIHDDWLNGDNIYNILSSSQKNNNIDNKFFMTTTLSSSSSIQDFNLRKNLNYINEPPPELLINKINDDTYDIKLKFLKDKLKDNFSKTMMERSLCLRDLKNLKYQLSGIESSLSLTKNFDNSISQILSSIAKNITDFENLKKDLAENNKNDDSLEIDETESMVNFFNDRKGISLKEKAPFKEIQMIKNSMILEEQLNDTVEEQQKISNYLSLEVNKKAHNEFQKSMNENISSLKNNDDDDNYENDNYKEKNKNETLYDNIFSNELLSLENEKNIDEVNQLFFNLCENFSNKNNDEKPKGKNIIKKNNNNKEYSVNNKNSDIIKIDIKA